MKTNISIIIPCYNSGAYLERTVGEIRAALAEEPDLKAQIVLVNDGSSDDTFEAVRRLCALDGRIVGVDLAENAGQANARMAGLSFARGSIALFMDDDGQHPARGIGPLVRKCQEGYHLVYARFPVLRETGFRRFAGSVHNCMLTVLAGKPVGLRITSFFAVDAAGLALIRGEKRPRPFIGATFFRRTRKITSVPMDHRERAEGRSNYNFRKLVRFWYSMMIEPYLPRREEGPAWKAREVLNPPPELTR